MIFKKKDIDTYIIQHRKKIPKDYNQIKLLDELTDPSIYWYVSISNRSDGKSYNYIGTFLRLAIHYNLKFTLVCRHYTVRFAYATFLMEIVEESKDLDIKKLNVKRHDDYLLVTYEGKPVGIITDLNNATDLKYQSNFIKNYPIIIYDEFLALKDDYLPDEWERLKTIYQSIDRNSEELPIIKYPKLFLLGNAVNFDSPILAGLDLFNKLETHEINTMKRYDDILLEMNHNERVNKKRNTRAFRSENDSMLTGRFKVNSYNIATEQDRNRIRNDSRVFHVKLRDLYLKVTYNIYSYECILSVVNQVQDYEFCTEIHDKLDNVTYIKDTFYHELHPKKYTKKGLLLFENAFSKNYITDSPLAELKIHKLIASYETNFKEFDIVENKEKVFKENQMEQMKKALFNKFFGG